MRRVWAVISMFTLDAYVAAAQKKKTSIADSCIGAWNSHDVAKVIAIFTDDVLRRLNPGEEWS